MNQQVNVNIRMDKDVKERADRLFDKMGLNMTMAVNTFVRQCLKEESVPFQVKPYDDYRDKVELSMRQANEGKLVTFSVDELESLEDMETGEALEFVKIRRRAAGLQQFP